MSHPFHVYGAALGVVSALRLVLDGLVKSDRVLADQLRRAALDVAQAWGMVGAAPAAEAELDRVLAMLWLGLSPSGLRPGRAAHAALFASCKWWKLTHWRG